MKNSEVDNKKINKYGKLKNILSIWSFNHKRSPYGRLMKNKDILCAHREMQQWGVNYWETYYPVANWISISSLLDIEIIHELQSRSIEFVLTFPQDDLDADVFMDLPSGIVVDGNRG